MNFHDVEILYNMYLAFCLISIFTALNEIYKYDTQLYTAMCVIANNINNFLFFNNAYKDVPVCSVLETIRPAVVPYEQRYLEKVRLIPNNYVFSLSETQIMNDKMNEISIEQQELHTKINHLSDEEDITDLQKQILTPSEVLEKAEAYVINTRLNTLINNVIKKMYIINEC